jgi:hypothetical protein
MKGGVSNVNPINIFIMKKLFYISIFLTLSMSACNSDKTPEITYIKAGFGQSNELAAIAEDDSLAEDVLMGQLPMKVVLKIEKNRKLRYMQLTNVIKYVQESTDSVVYDLTFESPSVSGQRKSVLFDQNGNKIYKQNLNLNNKP